MYLSPKTSWHTLAHYQPDIRTPSIFILHNEFPVKQYRAIFTADRTLSALSTLHMVRVPDLGSRVRARHSAIFDSFRSS